MKRRSFFKLGLAAAVAPLIPTNIVGSETAMTPFGPDDYEEGAWLPMVTDSTGKVLTSGVGRYTRIGSVVTVSLTATFKIPPGESISMTGVPAAR